MGHDLLNVAYVKNVTDSNQTAVDYEKQRQRELAIIVDISRYYIEGVILMPVATIGLFGKKICIIALYGYVIVNITSNIYKHNYLVMIIVF